MRLTEYSHRGGCSSESALSATRIALENHTISDDKYRIGIMASLRSVGWSGERKILRESKLKISGELMNTGLVLWFGNMHSIHEYIMTLELLHFRNEINSGIIVTASKDEAIRRFFRNKPEQGTSTGNYSEIETLITHLESLTDIINIPLTVIGVGE